MSDSIIIKSRAIPANSRSKNYRAGGVIQTTGGGGGGSSSSGSGAGDAGLSKDIRVNAPKIGHLDTGEILRQGMGYEQIFRKMLYAPTPATLVGKLSTANDVEYGSEKGTITYTATRNDSGAMVKAFYDDKEENVLEFTGDAAGVQTATRKLEGNYTKGETYTATVVYGASEDISEAILTNKISVNVKRKWFAGVCSSIPATSADIRALASGGLYNGPGSYKFTIGNYRTFVICIPSDVVREVSLERYQYNFMDLDSAATPRKINVEGANGSAAVEYTMYVFSTATTSTETDNFTFKTN